jgi:AraC family transcriptional regulator
LTDPHIMAVLLAKTTDLAEDSPAGRLYGESLANALAVYLLNRYTVRRYTLAAYRGGLPGYRLKRVLDYIGDNLAGDLSLPQLAAVVSMSRITLPSCSAKAPVTRLSALCYCKE